MNISDLIALLLELKEKHGDCRIYLTNDGMNTLNYVGVQHMKLTRWGSEKFAFVMWGYKMIKVLENVQAETCHACQRKANGEKMVIFRESDIVKLLRLLPKKEFFGIELTAKEFKEIKKHLQIL